MKVKPLSQAMKERLPIWVAAAGIVCAFAISGHILSSFQTPKTQEASPVAQSQEQAFYNDCVMGVLAGQPHPPSCASASAIKAQYNLDPFVVLNQEKGRLIMTAIKISRGEIIDEDGYKKCIDEGHCLPVPRPGRGAEDESKKGKDARRLFWHLIENGRLTPSVCDLLPTCRAYVRIGLIDQNTLGKE